MCFCMGSQSQLVRIAIGLHPPNIVLYRWAMDHQGGGGVITGHFRPLHVESYVNIGSSIGTSVYNRHYAD
jgi:hypothetical protein